MMFAVIATNFTAISLEPMGNLAGTATAITGFVSTTFGAILGGGVGQLFNGTVQPLFGGFAPVRRRQHYCHALGRRRQALHPSRRRSASWIRVHRSLLRRKKAR
jgi:hypothetical protein